MLLAAVALPEGARARQDWRAAAIASFNEAWQTIADTFYDPTFGGLDWPAVRVELLPKAQAADSPDAVRRVIDEMLARLKRSHFVLLGPPTTEDALPGAATLSIDVRLTPAGAAITAVENRSTAARAGLSPGQIILDIDGVAVSSMSAASQGADERLKNFDAWRRVYRALHGAPGSTTNVRVRDVRGVERVIAVARSAESGERVSLGNLPALRVRVNSRELKTPRRRTVGLIGFNYWMAMVDAPVAAAVDRFRHADGFVIDLRGNAGGLAGMMSGIAGHFFSSRVLLGKMQVRDAPLEFHANPRLSTAAGKRVEPFNGLVAILVDELTASASECFAGALQSLGRARVFGRQTMGEALPASTRRLTNGDVLMYALGDFVTSTGRRLEGEGVVPDRVVPLDHEALLELSNGRDPVISAALAWIDAQKR